MEKKTDKLPGIVENWQNIYEDFWRHFGECFHYKSTQCHAERYVRALLARMERKNGWQMAQYLEDKSPHAIQNFLGRAAWDAGKVRDALIQYAKNHLLSDTVVPILQLQISENGILQNQKPLSQSEKWSFFIGICHFNRQFCILQL